MMNDFDDEESDDFYESSDNEENVKPKTKTAPKKSNAKSTAPKKTTGKAVAKIAATTSKIDRVLAPKENTSSNGSTTNATKSIDHREKTVEEKYQKKSQIEHILLRPDTYSTYKAPYR
jgi:hypothetical protein